MLAFVVAEALPLPSVSKRSGLRVERRVIRVLTTNSKINYFADQATQHGLIYEALRQFEDDLNAKLQTKNLRVNVVFLPVAHDELIPALLAGRGDIVAAGTLFTAGPARIRGLRQRAAQRGLNPNAWFNNVEIVAAEAIGRETVTYVSNIYKYYLAYRMLLEQRDRRAQALEKAQTPQ